MSGQWSQPGGGQPQGPWQPNGGPAGSPGGPNQGPQPYHPGAPQGGFGPQGPQPPMGAGGPQGPMGPQGPYGPAGPQGPKKKGGAAGWIIGGAVVGLLVLGLIAWLVIGAVTGKKPTTTAPAPAPTMSQSTAGTSPTPTRSVGPTATASTTTDTSQYKKVATAKLPEQVGGGFTRDHSSDTTPGGSFTDRAYYRTPDKKFLSATSMISKYDNSLEKIERNDAFAPYERFGDVTCGQSKLSSIGPICFHLLDGGVLMVQGDKSLSKQTLSTMTNELYNGLP